MARTWVAGLGLLLACASGQGAGPLTAATPGTKGQEAEDTGARSGLASKATPTASKAAEAASSAKTTTGSSVCTPVPNLAPKVVAGEGTVSDVGETGQTLIFDVAGIALELPACTPDADLSVMTVSWDTKDRPTAARIDPNFTRHAATLRMNLAISALADAPILVRLHSKRELAKNGERLVLAVETSGDCDEQNKRDKLDDGGCSRWQLFDTAFDAQSNEMVARIPATGGYRLQFGWVPRH